MRTLALAWRYLWARPLGAALNVLLLSLGLASITFLLLVSAQLARAFDRDLAGIDVVVGAKGSPMQLILSGVLHIDVPPGNIPLKGVRELEKHPLVANTIPISLGDNFRAYRIVGTSPEAIACVRALIADRLPAITSAPIDATSPPPCSTAPPPGPPHPPPGPADPTHVIRGTITFAKGLRPVANATIFVMAKRLDTAGNPTGTPIAVAKATDDGHAITFELGETAAMGPLVGELVIVARADADSDALTKTAGDVTGQVRVTAPATDVALVLDTGSR